MIANNKWADYVLTGRVGDISTLTPHAQAIVGLVREALVFAISGVATTVATDLLNGKSIFTINYAQSIAFAILYLAINYIWRVTRSNPQNSLVGLANQKLADKVASEGVVLQPPMQSGVPEVPKE